MVWQVILRFIIEYVLISTSGIDNDKDGRPYLQDFEIYTDIIANLPNSERVKYPSLVSFVGQTGQFQAGF